jgi:hypothetical protein
MLIVPSKSYEEQPDPMKNLQNPHSETVPDPMKTPVSLKNLQSPLKNPQIQIPKEKSDPKSQ